MIWWQMSSPNPYKANISKNCEITWIFPKSNQQENNEAKERNVKKERVGRI
jgi:hypothetical protein